MTLKDKVAIITGAGKGIGRATALALAKEGVSLGLIARTKEDLEAVAKEAENHGVKVAIATADIANYEEVKGAIADLHESLGQFDILINKAGIANVGGCVYLSVAVWVRIFEVSLLGMYYVTRDRLPKMIEQKAGDITNISSTAGEKGGPTTSAYSASKFGVLGSTESLAIEARKHDIRVTAL